MEDTPLLPKQIEKHSDTQIRIGWTNGETFLLPYQELRFQCPCASCVDENTGKRVIRREQVATDVRPKNVQLVGKYAIQIDWSDGHSTGMYGFDSLYQICQKQGQPA